MPFYYKKADNQILISSFIFDMIQFVQGIVSASVVEFEDLKEKTEKETFKTEANL